MSDHRWDGGDASRIKALIAERDRLREALERIASLKPRPILDPYDCEERLKVIARKALAGSVSDKDPS